MKTIGHVIELAAGIPGSELVFLEAGTVRRMRIRGDIPKRRNGLRRAPNKKAGLRLRPSRTEKNGAVPLDLIDCGEMGLRIV